MSDKAHYFRVGIFFMVSVSLIVGILVFFGAGQLFEKKIYIETYFDDSVQGLDIGSPVKFRGVTLGEVSNIQLLSDVYLFSPDTPQYWKFGRYVVVTMAFDYNSVGKSRIDISKAAVTKRVEEGLRVRLAFLGITGLAYIEADYFDPEDNKPLEIIWDPINTYIPSTSNTISRLEDSVTDFLKTVDEDLFPMLQNLKLASENVPNLLYNFNTSLLTVNDLLINNKEEIKETLHHVKQVSKNINEITTLVKKHPAQLLFSEAPKKSRYDL